MTLTLVRRHVADNYGVYALILKLMYLIAFGLLSYGHPSAALAVLIATIFLDVATDGLVLHTIRRSRKRLEVWRAVANSLGGSRRMDRYLERRALEFARHSSDYLQAEQQFAQFVFAFSRIVDFKPRGNGQIADYLPRDPKLMPTAA